MLNEHVKMCRAVSENRAGESFIDCLAPPRGMLLVGFGESHRFIAAMIFVWRR
jgi:hypothetical protein